MVGVGEIQLPRDHAIGGFIRGAPDMQFQRHARTRRDIRQDGVPVRRGRLQAPVIEHAERIRCGRRSLACRAQQQGQAHPCSPHVVSHDLLFERQLLLCGERSFEPGNNKTGARCMAPHNDGQSLPILNPRANHMDTP